MAEEKKNAAEAAEAAARQQEDAEGKVESTNETEDCAAPAEETPAAETQASAEEEAVVEDTPDERDEKIAALSDRVARQMAEFDNFRKRTEKEKAAMFDMGARSVIEKMLPVIDNFERGFAGLTEEAKEDPFAAGMDKVYKQLMAEFDAIGVKAIEALGQPFNPELHNAVMHVEDENAGENEVVEEFQKGYTYRDTVVRYSMVKVAN